MTQCSLFWVNYSIKLQLLFLIFQHRLLSRRRCSRWTSLTGWYGCKRRATREWLLCDEDKKDQYQFLQNCTRKLMRDPTVFIQHFSLLNFTHYNHHISKKTERGCDPSLWFLTSTPPLFQYFTQALSELKCWSRGHFPSAHIHGVFIY